LHSRLPGSHQCRLCRVADAVATWVQRCRVWARSGNVLCRLLCISAAQQSDSGKGGSTTLDLTSHGGVGNYFFLHDLCGYGSRLLHPEIPVRCSRGGLLAGSDSLLETLVPAERAGTHCGALHDRSAAVGCNWRADIGRAAGLSPSWRPGWMAMAVSDGRDTGNPAGSTGVVCARERPRRSPLAAVGAQAVAGG